MICWAISFWQPIASSVTVAPLSSSSSNNSGMAVISLDFASTATCPKVSRVSLAQALTRCKGERPAARVDEPRRVLPSNRDVLPKLAADFHQPLSLNWTRIYQSVALLRQLI